MLTIDKMTTNERLFTELTPQQSAACCGGADEFGAIAYSPGNGAAGWSFNYSNRTAAENRALRECESSSGLGDCFVAVWVQNAWASLARASNLAYGWAWNTDKGAAEANALQECSKNGLNCNLVTTIQA
ncbi:DUF4189 domain-containing protein [Nostoc sp. CHAB 5836]|uniref:DUF4189 domain-containing protein n=1 Tax=Nostoc sp. CHAB 5836 TaxID=2780404 RepID=UPI001E4B35D7|nr:DUF4189 domain-containing protein [Nostoc sp. CHAB 5836]MCC5614016.1 DUF4189 domain-containing protein [Nostoc sp. CHAB 5836]